MKYFIWYNSTTREYNCGDEMSFQVAISSAQGSAILAEEFVNTSSRIVEKITSKLNSNLALVQ